MKGRLCPNAELNFMTLITLTQIAFFEKNRVKQKFALDQCFLHQLGGGE